jgi:integrase
MDDTLTGFGLRVSAGGTRQFFLDYRRNGPKRIAIGKWGDWTADEARAKAKEYRQRVDSGQDPAGEKRTRRDAPTMGDLAARFKQAREGERSRPKDEARMVAEILGIVGAATKVASVHHGDMEDLHKKISVGYHDGKKDRKPRPVRANRILACASVMFSMSMRPLAGENDPWRNQAQGNPCKGVERNPEEESGRLYSIDELDAIGTALSEYSGEVAVDCVRLIMTTGCRPCEAKRALWSEFDHDEPGIWKKPSSHTKQRKVHRLPLSPPALALVERLRAKRETGKPMVFPSTRTDDGTFDATQHVWRFVCQRGSVLLWSRSRDERVSGLVASLRDGLKREPTAKECLGAAKIAGVELPVALLGKTKETQSRLYDCRHSLARYAGGAGASLLVISKLLGHSSAKTTERYLKYLEDDVVRTAASRATDRMFGTPAAPDNVVTIGR